MGNALPVQEPTMDEILASIRRIIEGGEDADRAPSRAAKPDLRPLDRPATAPKTVSDDDVAIVDALVAKVAATAAVTENSAQPRAVSQPVAMATTGDARSEAETVSVRDEVSHTVPLKAVNDDSTAAAASSLTSPVEREVATQMAELATLSVARMRAASLEDAVRDQRRRKAAGPASQSEPEQEPAPADNMAFFDEFDEAAFANELLMNAGLLSEPYDHPQTVTLSEAANLRLAYPESPSADDDGGAEPDADLSDAVDAAIAAVGDDLSDTVAPAGEPVAQDVAARGAVSDMSSSEGRDSVTVDAVGESVVRTAFAAGDAGAPDTGSAPASPVLGDNEAVFAASKGALVSLISDNAGSKISSSFLELATALRDEQAQRMDQTVREMLQPMLSDWLEDNLPLIVERLVREEIERVARGPRSA
ncbi:DUF2497 domain-containing protein [Fulvimarina endophytica]|uniref:DUF2497 domain-containing protein n=1 Tax=Fulvimarina endophytica TaxID=2293836 RepID=A0A371X0S8_9HYPH|nr:DUF2497 domain-containing protein [Fulvimarina endophytica]RFC62832.1 DUF2497 domain-containing protein [Fulvimarina endophytica]